MSEWISVEDSVPEQDVEVLFYWEDGDIQVDYIEDELKPYDWACPPTHWMPLPEPPE